MTTATDRYLARLRNVLAHIDAHLDEALDVARLAEVAAFSPYHFHRQFTLLFGVNVGRYVQLLRLKRAAHQLAYRDAARITDIALACGYEGPEAFARAFRKQSGQSPSAFRAAPQWGTWATDLQALRALRSEHMPAQPQPHAVEIIEREDVPVAAIEHRGNPARLGETLRAFIAWRRANRLPPAVSATYNIVYDNPDDTPPEAFRMDICAATPAPVAPNAPGWWARPWPAAGTRCCAIPVRTTRWTRPSPTCMPNGCRPAGKNRAMRRCCSSACGSTPMCPSTRP